MNRYFQRFNRYTTQAAERYHREGRKPYVWNFFLHPGWEFFKMYILKLGILDGIPGLAICSVCAFTRFVRYMKLYARLQAGLQSLNLPVELDATFDSSADDGFVPCKVGDTDSGLEILKCTTNELLDSYPQLETHVVGLPHQDYALPG